MSFFFKIYIFGWIVICFSAICLCTRHRSHYAFLHRNYWVFLLKPWKVITFTIAAAFLTLVAPYTRDHTWDYYDTSLMSILTFLTAPWAVGIFYRFREGKAQFKQLFVAFCVWMFSASWSYDSYMYFREGRYPPTWLPNIVLSSILYACAGLLWSLDWTKEKGVFMSFKEGNWPTKSIGLVFHKIFVATIPYALVVVLLCALVIYKLHFPE